MVAYLSSKEYLSMVKRSLLCVALLTTAWYASAQKVVALPDDKLSGIGFASSLIGKPVDWPGKDEDLFSANFNFPNSFAAIDGSSWLTLDPRKPEELSKYYEAVLANALTSFQGDMTTGCPKVSNDWYHVPWMTFSFGTTLERINKGEIGSGREPICGLTQERYARKKFLHSSFDKEAQSWAVGMFNSPGGYLLGKVWRDRSKVNLSETKFPHGTFIAKFLFTEATDQDVPYLTGAPVWKANVYTQALNPQGPRVTKPMRLVQIDFGIRDKRFDEQTGWVYGTYLYYNVDQKSSGLWTSNLVPVGLMWGNDHGKTNASDFKEQLLNPTVAKLRNEGKLFDTKVRPEFGWKDRVNGPIDNPTSACLSCHSTAQVHPKNAIKHFLTPALLKSASTDTNRMLWFRNLRAGETFTFTATDLKLIDQGDANTARSDWSPELMKDFVSTDYSLQLRMAIENARSLDFDKSLMDFDALAKGKGPLLSATPPAVRWKRDMRRESKRVERDGLKP